MSFDDLAQKKQLLNCFENRLIEEYDKYRKGEEITSLFSMSIAILIIFFIMSVAIYYIDDRDFHLMEIATNIYPMFYVFLYFAFVVNALRHRLIMKSSFKEMKKISNELSLAKYKITPGSYGSKKMRIVQESDDAQKIDFNFCHWKNLAAYCSDLSLISRLAQPPC